MKNVVFVTAPGVKTAIPYLLVDSFSLGKREIEWAQVFLPGVGSATMRALWWWPLLLTACLAADTAPGAATGGHSLKGGWHGNIF